MHAERAGADIGRGVLQAIFVVFLGLMITAVVGVGVYTFLPNPAEARSSRSRTSTSSRGTVEGCGTASGATSIDQLTLPSGPSSRRLDIEVKALGTTPKAARGVGPATSMS